MNFSFGLFRKSARTKSVELQPPSKGLPQDALCEGPPSLLPHTPDVPVLSVRGLIKTYLMGETVVHALRGLDLDVHEGELVVLLGQSGSGKSTLLNILGGLDVPSEGDVRYRGHVLSEPNTVSLDAYRRNHVGFVFQFFNLIPSLTALENVALATEIAKTPMNPEEAIKVVGLEDRMSHYPSQMSGGQQQRVAIARAIAKRPDILLCDEPTGALDLETGKLVLEVIANINQALRTTTILITHNASIANMADRVLFLGDGRIIGTRVNSTKATPSELQW